MRPYDTIFFDAGRVLVNFDQERAFRQIAAVCHRTPQEVCEFYLGGGHHLAYESGAISTDELVALFAAFAARPIERDALINAAADMFEPIAGMDELVLAVKGQGISIAIISNTCEIHWEHVERHYRIVHHFPQWFLSHELGYMKPARAIYEHALHATGAAPERSLFIDDLKENLAGAESLGFATHLFTGVDALRAYLAIAP